MSWASRHNLLARAVNRSLGGVPVIWGAVSGEALLEQNTELIVGGQVMSVEYALSNLPSAQFGALSHGDPIVVAGEGYTVRHAPMLVGDGAFCMVLLEKTSEPETVFVIDGDWESLDSTAEPETVFVIDGDWT
jgi:hypothetical protein